MQKKYFFLISCFTSFLNASISFAQITEMFRSSPIEVNEIVQEVEGTMSGSQRLSIRTNTLFSAFQLIRDVRDAEGHNDPKIKIASLKAAPIRVPSLAAENLDLRLCTEIKTVNGFYEAVGESGPLKDKNKSIPSTLVRAKMSDRIDGNYTESLMLLRSFVAQDCSSERSSYYVPMFFHNDANTFLAVFEIGNASITASLYGVDSKGRTEDREMLKLHCAATKRVDRGYDCTFPLDNEALLLRDLYEIRLEIKSPYHPQPRKFLARITIPEEMIYNAR